ncbi:MAG: ComEC/Rec2 family competence protein, partial [Alkalibacterium sp.]
MISGKLVFVALVMLPIAAGLTSGFSLPVMIVTVFFWQRLVIQKSRSLIICTLCIILLLNIRFHHFQLNDTSITMSESEWVTIAVKQTSWKVDGDKLEFEGRIETGELSDKVRATYYIKEEGEKNRLAEMIPKTVVVKGTLSTPHEPSNFNQFNYKTYLKSKTISQILKVSDLLIPHQFEEKGSHYYVLDSMRQKVLSHIDQTMTPQTGGYTKTLLFADKRTFSTDVMDSFKELGIIHLLSISGLHIVFIINLLSRFLLRMNVSKEATTSSLLMILPIYGITTGLGISVIRAIGQSWIKLSGEKLGVKVSALDSWSIMLLISLIMQPYNLYAIGFQLSFLISLVIILISHQEFTKNWSSIKKYIGMNTLLLLASIPVLSYHFYEFSWGVLVLNSLFIPFVANILLPLLIISFMLSIIIPRSALFLGVLFLVDELIGGMESIVSTVSRSFSFTFITGRLSQSAYFLLVLAILLLFIRLERGKTKRFLIGPVTGILLCLLSVRYSPWGQVLMIDVGQGEAILIKEPWGRGSYL